MAESVGGPDMPRPSGSAGYGVFSSADEMLSPAALALVLARPVRSVERRPFTPTVWFSSGARFDEVYLDGEAAPSLVMKTAIPENDWGAIWFEDKVDREVRLWEAGLLDRLPRPATHATLAAARSEAGYSVLMPNLAGRLLPDEAKGSPGPGDQRLVLEALAAMHAEFWMDDAITDPYVGLTSLEAFVGHMSLKCRECLVPRLGATIGDFIDDAWSTIMGGWERLRSIADPGLVSELWALANDPTPVIEAASEFPWTLAHTDLRPANIAIDAATPSVYLFDWTRPIAAPPALDMVYWLWAGNEHLSMPREVVIESYRAALERRLDKRFSNDWWQPQLDLCFVAMFASFAPIIAGRQPDSVSWWIERIRPGLASLS